MRSLILLCIRGLWLLLVCLLAVQEDVVSNGERETDDEHEEAAKESFINLAGEDGEVDAFELQNILNGVFKRGSCHRQY